MKKILDLAKSFEVEKLEERTEFYGGHGGGHCDCECPGGGGGTP